MTRNAETVRLRLDVFDRLCGQRGWELDKDRAAGIGISQSVISGIRHGKRNPGTRFISRCMATFGASTFEALFEVES